MIAGLVQNQEVGIQSQAPISDTRMALAAAQSAGRGVNIKMA